MRYLIGLAGLALLLVACGPAPTEEVAATPAHPPSVVFGPVDAPAGGTLVVGHLVPLGPSPRLVELIGDEAYAAFLRQEAARLETSEDERLEEIEEETLEVYEYEDWPLGRELWEKRSRFRDAVAAAVREATGVKVLFRDVLATACEGLPLVIADARRIEARERAALEAYVARGGDLVRAGEAAEGPGRSLAGAVPDSTSAEAIQPLVDLCLATIRTSSLVHRLAVDPLEVVGARREGDDVIVRTAGTITRAHLVSLGGEHVAEGEALPDGGVRLPAPEATHDPFAHQVVLEHAQEGLHLRRGFPVAELVGVTERMILATKDVMAGAPYAPHVLFTADRTGAPVAGVVEKVSVVRGDAVLVETVATSTEAGGLDLALAIPPDTEPGPAELVVGDDRFPVEIRRPVAISVVTDRPVYRPTDLLHVRVMVHDTVRGAPLGGEEVVLRLGSVEKRVRTSDHGIASTDFRLVEAKPGPQTIEARVGRASASRTVRVQAFELPTFTVTLEPSSLELQEGEEAPVDVLCRYVNGEPLVGATVRAWGETGDVRTDARKRQTDAGGRVTFRVRRRPHPDVGTLVVSVQDADGRMERTVLEVKAPPAEPHALGHELREDLVAGLPGRIGIRGAPGETVEARVGEQTQRVTLDVDGRGEVRLTLPEDEADLVLRGKDGREARSSLPALVPAARQPFLVLDRRTATVGDTIRVRLGGPPGPVILEVRRGDTVLRSLALLLGTELLPVDLDLDSDLAGVLEIGVLRPLAKGALGTTTRLLVTRGRALAVEARTEADAYRPAATAHVDVEVRDAAGRPTAAVLGYWGVDEALLSMAPWPDGHEDVFDLAGGQADLAARVERDRMPTFAEATAALGSTRSSGETGWHHRWAIDQRRSSERAERANTRRREVAQERRDAARKAWLAAYDGVPLEALRTADSVHESLAFVTARGDLDPETLLDPWGTPFALGHGETHIRWTERTSPRSWWHREYVGAPLTSAGPDLVFGTDDDVHLVWTFAHGWELEERLARFLAYVEDVLGERLEDPEGQAELLSILGPYTPFFGPALNGLIGLGGGAGGAFWGRGGGRDLGAGGGGRMANRSPEIHVRRDFEPTLCFVPEAIVGPEGRTRLEIPLRDSITTWQLRLVASAADGATGIGHGRIRVTQPLHANPWVANHLTVGDLLEVPVAVRNETDAAFEADVVASLRGGVALDGPEAQTVHVPPHGTGSATFRMRAAAPGLGHVRIDVRAGDHADAIERVVHVRHDARDETATWYATLRAGEPWRPDLPAAADGLPHAYALKVYASPMATIVGGLDGLLTCPHG